MALQQSLSEWAIHVAVGSFVLLAGGAALAGCCRQPVDRIRCIAWTLVACLLLPMLAFLPGIPRFTIGWLRPPTSAAMQSNTVDLAATDSSTNLRDAMTETSFSHGAVEVQSMGSPHRMPISESRPLAASFPNFGIWDLAEFIAVIYLLVALLVVGKWIADCWKLRRFRQSSAPAPDWLRERLIQIAGPAARRVELRISSQLDAPITWGAARPIMVIPESMLHGDDSLRYGLAHEWSHIERRDWLVIMLAQVVESVAFYQPLFWWLRRQLLLCQDYLADARAAELAPSSDDYAAFLVSIGHARLAAAPAGALGLGNGRSRLFHRVKMLVENPLLLRHRCRFGWNCTIAMLALLLTVGVSSVSVRAKSTAPVEPAAPAQNATDKKSDENKPTAKAETAGKALPEPITYVGKVADRDSGKPIEGATVIVERSTSRDPKTGKEKPIETTEHRTDEKGNYTFTLPPEQVADPYLYLVVDAKHLHYASKGKSGYSHAMIRKNLELGEEPFYADIRLCPGKPITFVVENPAGQPLAGARILMYSKAKQAPQFGFGFGSFQESTSDSQGRCQIVAHTPGDGVLWISHADYAPQAHRLRDRRGDWGKITLDEGARISGTLLSAKGTAIPDVQLSIRRDGDGEEADEFLGQNAVGNGISREATSDASGNFALSPLPPGSYRLEVQRRRKENFEHVFGAKRIEIKGKEKLAPVEMRAEPPVFIRATYLNSKDLPRTGHEFHIFGRFNNESFFCQSTSAGADGKLQAIVPHGLEKVQIHLTTNEHCSLRWRMSRNEPLQNSSTITLDRINDDVTGIEIIRYEAPILLVKAVDGKGELIKDIKPKVVYKANSPKIKGSRFISGVDGDVNFEKQQDGRWRSSQLLPGEDLIATVDLDGYTTEEESLTLPEGEVKELTFVMQPKASESKKE